MLKPDSTAIGDRPLQQAAPANLLEGLAELDVLRYVPMPGTWAFDDAWASDINSPFAQTLLRHQFTPIRDRDGQPFRAYVGLDGVLINRRRRVWEGWAYALKYFLQDLPYRDRIVFAHSHAGNAALILASTGFPLRALITIGTPPRPGDIAIATAEQHIGYHLHIYDDTWDVMGWLGQIGDKDRSPDRFFEDRHVVNISVKDIRHSNVLREPVYVAYWEMKGWLDLIRRNVTEKEAA